MARIGYRLRREVIRDTDNRADSSHSVVKPAHKRICVKVMLVRSLHVNEE